VHASKVKAVLDLLPEQGLAAATAALLPVMMKQSALAAGQSLLQRCCLRTTATPRSSALWFDDTTVHAAVYIGA
jgi:hypothetical protein